MLSIPLAWRLARRLHDSRIDDDPHAEADALWQRLSRSWVLLDDLRDRWLQARDRFPAAGERLRERSLCNDCRLACSGCSQSTPKARLVNRLCPTCREIPEDEPNDDDTAPADETIQAEPSRA